MIRFEGTKNHELAFRVVVRQGATFKGLHGGVTDTGVRAACLGIATHLFQLFEHKFGNCPRTDHLPSHPITNHEDDVLGFLGLSA